MTGWHRNRAELINAEEDTVAFSVVIPAHRRPEMLAKCLAALAPGVQTLSSKYYEVIVSDDSPPEESLETLIFDRFPWAHWVQGPRKGPAANRNAGASLARGSWLVFTDDDCLPSPNCLAAYSTAICPGIDVYEGRTSCLKGIRSPLEHAPVNLTGGYLWSCNMMIAHELFRVIGGFNIGFPHPHMEDVELRERVLTRSNILFVKEAWVDHPPRRLPPGRDLAAYHESRVYYDALRRRRRPLVAFLFEIIHCRLRALLSHKPGSDSVRAIVSLCAELATVIAKMPGWERKYRSVEKVNA